MEGGQKIDINLESPLDTKSSDMLVNVQDIKFAHNRQKYQGHVLPTSLRYEHNGWAAGWYVYDFEVGGGIIFSKSAVNNSHVPWLTATRTKLNNTPTYVFTFRSASAHDLEDSSVVSPIIQCQAWFTKSQYINARECKEASIDRNASNALHPDIHFNYATNDVDYVDDFTFIYNVCDPEDEPTFESITNNGNLSLEYEDRAPDGTVQALLSNERINWTYTFNVYVPSDLIDDLGNVYAKFAGLSNGTVTWDLPISTDETKHITYKHNQGYRYEATAVNNNILSLTYLADLTYKVPLNKYYAKLKDISWTIQGTRALLNSEDQDDPMNRYSINIENISQSDINIHDGTLQDVGIDGPDVSIMSRAEFTIGSTAGANFGIRENTEAAAAIYTASQGTISTVPILTVSTKTFKLPGDTENRDVTIQVYFKYPGEYVNVGILDNRTCYMSVISYPFASMSAIEQSSALPGIGEIENINEPLVSHTPPRASIQYDCCFSRNPTYKIDGKLIQDDTAYNTINYADADTINIEKSVVSVRDIVGRVAKLHMSIKGINGVSYSGDNNVELNLTGINTNLIFSRYSEPDTWTISAASHSNITGSTSIDTIPPDNILGYKQESNVVEPAAPSQSSHLTSITYYLQNINELKVLVGIDGQLISTTTEDITNKLYVKFKLYSEGTGIVTTGYQNMNIVKFYYWNGHSYVLFKSVSTDEYFLLKDYEYYTTIDTVSNNNSVYITIDQYAYILDGEINWVNTFNHIPNKEDVNYTDYGYVIATDKGIYKLDSLSLPTTLWQCGQSGISNIGVTINSNITSVEKFEVVNDILRIYDGTNVYEMDLERMDYWIGKYTGNSNSIIISSLSRFCFDIKDNNTGELLVNHVDDVIEFDTASLQVYLDSNHCAVGSLYFANHVNAWHLLNQATAVRDNIDLVHKAGNIGTAFFPINKYSNTDGSVYQGNYGACQGIAVFKIFGSNIDVLPDGYYMNILSPLCKYTLPPIIVDDSLIVFAKRTFSHHINMECDTLSFNNTSLYSLNDASNNIDRITVTPRANIFSENSVSIENNNQYYVDKSLLVPTSVSYYNNQMHITYKANTGSTIVINGTTYDLSVSDLSVKQSTDLLAYYLPQYTGTGNKYQFTVSDKFTLNIKEANTLRNNITDDTLHYAIVNIYSISFNNDTPAITLRNTIHHDGETDSVQELVYSDPANLSGNEVDPEYSDENQLLLKTSIEGHANISLPEITVNFANDITAGKIKLVKNSNTYAWYDYNKNVITEMKIDNHEVARASIELVDTETHLGYTSYSLYLNQKLNTIIYFKHFGIYKLSYTDSRTKVNSISYNSITGEFTFNIERLVYVSGTDYVTTRAGTVLSYVLDFNDFDSGDLTRCTPKYLLYSATDVRNPDEHTNRKTFAKVLCDNEYQLVKQLWNTTVEVENYWWLDTSHILLLTKDRFIVKEKDLEADYDDWNGDTWKTVAEYNRTDYLTSEADTMLCSSVQGKNAKALLYLLQPVDYNTINVTIYDPLNNMSSVYSINITFKHIELGNSLNANAQVNSDLIEIHTYSDILASTLLSDSKLTAVEVGNKHCLGIQYDKNFNQWTFDLTNFKVIQGYGVIGINGYATGGMLPADYFGVIDNIIGFNDTVYNVNSLESEKDTVIKNIADFNKFNKRIVGDENQQWYIAQELKDIVMAVSMKNDNIIKLPITNKYAQVYSSPSYAKYTVHALAIQIKQLADMFSSEENPIWKEIIKYAMFPMVWFLSPYTNVINYLQQTLGQYAYVHYNSTSVGKKGEKDHDNLETDNAGLSENESQYHINTLVSDDLSFDVQHISQEQSFKDNSWNNILGIFTSMVVSATDYSMQSLSVNSLQNQSAVSDIGKKFSQAFLQNMGSMSATGFTMQSTKPMLKSEVTAVKTLDMFYSTSAEQNCYAGPGFVNMQFVAQCTAQSVTSVQLDAQQTQIFFLLKDLTIWQSKIELYLLDLLKDWLFKQSDNTGGGPSAGLVIGLGWIGSMVLSSLGYALTAAKAMLRLATDTVMSILDSFFPSGIKTTVTAQLSRHNYDIEGKHAYGNKSECFMWPCADATSKVYIDESVEATLQEKPWPLEMPQATAGNKSIIEVYKGQPKCVTIKPSRLDDTEYNGDVEYNIASCKGTQRKRTLPDSTAYVIGTESFLPTVPFKNENIGEGEPVFTPPPIQDYIIDKNWNLFVTASAGDILWVSCKDTKLFDGTYSNIVVTDDFCGIACSHVALEVKREVSTEYLRPWAVTPDAIALNITGLNCAYEEVAYHAFDGYGYRITDWLGASGMNKEHYTLQYCFQVNDRFKRSNKLPPNQFMGDFQAVPSMSLDVKDKVYNDIQIIAEGKGLEIGVIGENKDQYRYSIPMFTEQVSTLPAIVKAHSSYKLAVIDGITSLTTDVRTAQTAYKLPVSIDFNINDQLYRMTNEYICSVKHEKGLDVVTYLVPALGLTYLGSTPFMAYFYNQATRQYYIYQGGNTLQVIDMLERFRNIKGGYYDFINQEVVMPCLATMSRLDKKVKDDADETDNIVIPLFRHNKVGGEVTPPITTIFNTRSWYKTLSTPAGLVFQGPNRCIINRFTWSDYMLEDIKKNKGCWKRVPREECHPYREYIGKYENVLSEVNGEGIVKGWTHNPFLLITSPIGINEETDCKFEWEITFAWTVEMEQLYEANEYVVVNIMAETMTPGGKVYSRPTHIFLTKELFTRSNNFGYYSFRYQSNSGQGNRERLHIWSDGYIAVSSLQLEYKIMSEKRNEILVTQEDIKGMKEM